MSILFFNWLSNNLENIRLTRVKLNPKYLYDTFKEQEVEVIGKEVFLVENNNYISIGYCNIINGKYIINTVNNLTYLQYITSKK